MADTISMPGNGSLVTIHDGANDPAIALYRNGLYFNVELVPGTIYRPMLLFGIVAPGTDYPNAPVGSLYVCMATGAVKLYIKTDATTWTLVASNT